MTETRPVGSSTRRHLRPRLTHRQANLGAILLLNTPGCHSWHHANDRTYPTDDNTAESTPADDDTTDLPPVRISMTDDWLAIATGEFHTCALHSDSTIECWGRDQYDQATPLDGAYTQITAGTYHTCALDPNGIVTCWGDDTYGQKDLPPFSQNRAGYDQLHVRQHGAFDQDRLPCLELESTMGRFGAAGVLLCVEDHPNTDQRTRDDTTRVSR